VKQLINSIRCSGAKHVMVIGDVMLDEYYMGSVSRISPEAPVPVLKEERVEWCLGGAANVAANCRQIGCEVVLVGSMGCDAAGNQLVSLLKEHKLDDRGILRLPRRVTTNKKRFIAQNQQLLRMDAESNEPLSAEEFAEMRQRIDALLVPQCMILISDYAKGVVTQALIEHVCMRARERGCTVLVDPKGPNFAKYYGVDYIKPNAKEFKQMIEFFQLPSLQTLEHNARTLCSLLSLKGLVITEGERGITFVSSHQTIVSPSCKREVYDLTGAGDTVFAFLALGLAHGFSMEDCLLLANHAAAVAISHLKTYAVSIDELIDPSLESTEKIYTDWVQLKIELDWLRAEGKKVVLTNGCFDILHVGHIQTLKEAKKYGDILVVAMNTDDSVQRLKGPSRPINNLMHRATMMSAVGFVDFVVSFDQDTPYALIDYLRPDALVKGGDYHKESVVGYELITSYGGAVHIVDYVPDNSTTGLIERCSGQQQKRATL